MNSTDPCRSSLRLAACRLLRTGVGLAWLALAWPGWSEPDLSPPQVTSPPVGATNLAGTAVTFTVVASGAVPLSYQWLFQDTNVLAAGTNTSLILPSIEPADAGSYSVWITNAFGSVTSPPAILVVLSPPAIGQNPVSLVATQNQTVTLAVSASGDPILTFQWRWFGTNLPGRNDASLSLISVSPAQAGPYDVVVANDVGAVTSAVASVTVYGLDFGDAPEPPYPTLNASDGARHVVVPGVYLGTQVSADPDGQPDASASGDGAGSSVEEDGVVLLSPLRAGEVASLAVFASTNGLLSAWVDFDHTNAWNDPGEQILTNRPVARGSNFFSILVPPTPLAGPTFARFRFSTAPIDSSTGLAPDGEVEDYAVTVLPSANLAVALSIVTNQVTAGSETILTVLVTNLGPTFATGVTLTNILSPRSTFLSATTSQGGCTNVNGTVTCGLGTLARGARAVVALTVRVGQGTNITTCQVGSDALDLSSANNQARGAILGTTTLTTLAAPDTIVLPLLDAGPGSIYPANITVSGVTSAVYKITVTALNINHDYPDDIDMILVGPGGQKTYLMSDCGLDNALVDVSITFDSDAAQALPDSDPQIVNGTYRPSNYGTLQDIFASPAPAGPYLTNLTVFRNTDPNGVWSLYVMDDQPENATPNSVEGFIADGWTLSIVTGDPLSDLSLTQTGSPNPIVVGNLLTYSFLASNAGPSIAAARVRDVLAPGVSFVSASISQGSCVSDAGVVTCELGNLAPGQSTTFAVVVAPTLGGPTTNQATISSANLDTNPSNNVATVVTTVIPVADLELTTGPIPGPALLGQPLTLNLGITNRGPNNATGVLLTNVLPAGLTFVSAVGTQGTCASQGDVVVCSLGSIAAAAGSVVNITALTVTAGAATNVAIVAGAELDLALGNNTSLRMVNIIPAADFGMSGLPVPASMLLKQTFTMVYNVTNRGPNSAEASFTDQLPASVKVLSATSTQGGCVASSNGVVCALGAIDPGQSALILVAAAGQALGTVTNTAWLTGSLADPTPGDLGLTNVITIIPGADLVVTLVDRPDPVWMGDNLTYTVTVTNQGPSAISTISLTNQLPLGAGLISFIPSQGGCLRRNGEVDCELGALAPGAGAVLTVTIRPTSVGSRQASAFALANVFDPNLSNNLATQFTQVVDVSGAATNLVLISIPRVGAATPFPSTLFVSGLTAAVSTVRVQLSGLTHTYPDDLDILLVGPNGRGVLLMSDAGGEFAISNTTLTFDDGALNPVPDSDPITNGFWRPANYELTPDLFPAPAPPGPYETNLAAFSGMDPNGAWSLYIVDDAEKDFGSLAGWSLQLATVTPIANLVLGQSFSANPVAVGSNVVMTYTATNLGPAIATDVRLTNRIPPTLKSVAISSSLGSCSAVGQDLVCTLGSLPPGSGAVITVSGTPQIADIETNLVSVGSALLDLKPSDNTLATLFITEDAPALTLQPVSQSVTNGDAVQFVAVASGTPPLLYQWQRNGANVPGATDAILQLDRATPALAGTYRLLVSNQVGSALSDPASLSVFGPPTISDISPVTIDEDTATGLIPFAVSDFESPADSLVVSASSSDPELVPPVRIVLGGSGTNRTVQVTPLPNATGSVTIFLVALDPDGLTSTNSFVLTIRPINDAPVLGAIADQITVEDVPLTVTFYAFDVETPADLLQFTLLSSNPGVLNPTNAFFAGTGTNRLLTLIPTTNESGTSVVTIVVMDADSASVSGSFVFTVTAENDAPTLDPIPDLSVIEESGPVSIGLSGIGTGAPNEIQHLTVSATSSNPALIPNPSVNYHSPDSTATLTFAPLPNASGTAILTVIVKDGQATNGSFSQSFTVTVPFGNDSPFIATLADQVMDEDTTLSVPLLVGDLDGGLDTLVFGVASGNPDMLPESNITLTGTGQIRTLTLRPATNQFGSGAVAIIVTDVQGARSAMIFNLTVLPVNDPPSFDPIADRTVGEDAPLQTVPLTGIFPGPGNETEPVTFSAVSSDTSIIPTPTVTYTSPSTAGTLTFRPAANATGTVTLTVTADDGRPENHLTSHSFTVTVLSSNDPPVITGLGSVSIDEDVTSSIPFSVSDVETPAALLLLSATSSNPALVTNTSLSFSGAGTNRSLVVTPQPNQFGTTTVNVVVTDGARSTTNGFLLTVNPVNDPPTLNALTNVNLTVSAGSTSIPLNGITGGPTNEPQTVTLTATNSNPALFVNAPSVSYPGTGPTGTLTFRPANNTTGSAVIGVTVNDGGTSNNVVTRTFVLNVHAVGNTQPTISAIANQTTAEDTPTGLIPFTVRDAETLANGLVVTANSSNPALIPNNNIVIAGTGTNRTVRLTPATNQTGTATITLTATDDAFGSTNLSFNITVTVVNDPPTLAAIPDQTTTQDIPTALIAVAIDDVDTPAASLLVTASSGNPLLLPNAGIAVGGSGRNRALILTPAPDQSGTATVTVRVSDGAASNSTSFVLTVLATNHPPLLSGFASVETDEDTPVSGLPFTVSDKETPPSGLLLSAASSNPALITSADVTFNGTGTNRTLTLNPTRDQSGSALITITVSDPDGAATSATFRFTVRSVNDPPTLAPIADVLINQDSTNQTLNLTGIGPGAGNEIQTLAVAAETGDPSLIANIVIDYTSPNSTGTLTFLPVPNTHGRASITVTVSDGQPTNGVTQRTFTVTINAPPTISDLFDQSTLEDTPGAAIPFTVTDDDTPAELITVTAFSSDPALVPPDHIAIQGTGTNRLIVLTPDTNRFGSATIYVTATDTNGAASTNQFQFTVEPVVDPIFISAQPGDRAGLVGSTTTFRVAATSTLPLSYQWRRDGLYLPGATNDTLTLSDLQPADAGTLDVLILNADTSIASGSARLDVLLTARAPQILAIERLGPAVKVRCTSVSGAVYHLEYRDVLSTGDWTLVDTQPGDGGAITLSDPDAATAMRFYRVRTD